MEQRRFTDADYTMTTAAPMPTPCTLIALKEASSCLDLHIPEDRDDACSSRGYIHRSSTSRHVRGTKASDDLWNTDLIETESSRT